MKCKCGHPAKDYILCTVTANGMADVDTEDRDYDDVRDITVDTGITVWLHVCRGCHEILDAGIEDQGVLAQQPAEPDAVNISIDADIADHVCIGEPPF